MNFAVELPSAFVREGIAKAVSDAGSPSFHEGGGIFGKREDGSEYLVRAQPGQKADPSKDAYASIDVFKAANPDDLKNIGTEISGTFHTHPDGEFKTGATGSGQLGPVTTHGFGTEPSNLTDNNGKPFGDLPNARANTTGVTGDSYVLAKGNRTIYIYNGGGTGATFPFRQFFSIGIKK